MLNTKHRGRYSRKKEMQEDLSILMGVQRSRQLAGASGGGTASPGFGQLSQSYSHSQYWQHPIRRDGNRGYGRKSPGQGQGFPGSGVQGSTFSPLGNVTIGSIPPLVTASQCRARYSTPSPTRSWGIVAQSRPVFRTPPARDSASKMTPQQDPPSRITLNRTLMPSIFRNVQRPPQTPRPELSATTTVNINNRDQQILLQSPWVTRESATTMLCKPVESSSSYSIRELIDILCGNLSVDKNDSTQPGNPSSDNNATGSKAVIESEYKRNEAFALGLLKLPRKPKTSTPIPKKNQSFENSSYVSHFPVAKRARTNGGLGSENDFLGLANLKNNIGETSLSFISTSPALFEDEGSNSKMSVIRRGTPYRKRVTFQEDYENLPPLF